MISYYMYACYSNKKCKIIIYTYTLYVFDKGRRLIINYYALDLLIKIIIY